MNKKLDKMLYASLSPVHEPDPELNRRILERHSKEVIIMKHFRFTKTAAAAVMACIVAVGGISSYAAYRYLSPAQIAKEVSDNQALEQAFESGGAIPLNENQSSGGLDITLLGLVSGAGLSPFVDIEQTGSLDDKQTYAAIAISRKDGGDIGEDSKCVSPLINGVDFMTANNGTLDAGLHWFIKDNVLYELLECDNLEIFAGRGVQIGVVDSFGNETSAFSMDEKTGAYKKNEEYTGTSALFDLPLDQSKADETAADAYIKKLMSQKDQDEENSEKLTPEEKALEQFLSDLKESEDPIAFLKERASLLEDSRQTLQMDEEGITTFQYDKTEGTVYAAGLETGRPTMQCVTGDGTIKNSVIHMFTRNQDGSVTYEAYKLGTGHF